LRTVAAINDGGGGVHGGHPGLELAWSGGEACTRYLRRNAV
jgi:hypothetical protein